MELLKEVVNDLAHVSIVSNPDHAGEQSELRESVAAARSLGLAAQPLRVRNDKDLETAFETMAKGEDRRPRDLSGRPDAQLPEGPGRLRHPTPDPRPWGAGRSSPADAGALMSYGPSLVAEWQNLGVYADRVLKGAKPADLPVQQPTRFELVVNLKTAQALGRTLAPAVMLRADRVIPA